VGGLGTNGVEIPSSTATE